MTAAVPAPGRAVRDGDTTEFQLVECSGGWELTIVLTEQLREALARGQATDELRCGVRVAPNLLPGEPFEAHLTIHDPSA